MNSNSPEDRLLDELLQEQSHGPDEAFLKQIEAAIDAGPSREVKLPTPRNYGRFAIAASVGLAVGISYFSYTQNRKSQLASTPTGIEKQTAANTIAAMTPQELSKAIRDQEDKVEERRKVLATIPRTKGIIYPGKDSYYDESRVDADQAPRNPSSDLASNESTREQSIIRGLDAQDYGDAKRDYERDQQILEELKGGETTSANVPDSGGLPTAPSAEAAVGNTAIAPNAGNGLKVGQVAENTDSLAYNKKMPAVDATAPPATRASQATDKSRYDGLTLEREQKPTVEAQTGDRYGTFIDQPWKSPTRDKFSTFSIDVDTASYSNVRRMIREGREVPKDAVRIEEFINAFKYQYDAPKGDGPFAVGAALADCPWAPGHQLVRISIKGREIDTQKRPASNLVFLIDVSGSMQSPDKLPLLKHSMETMVSQLDERDRVAIVVYAGSEGVALPSTRLDEEGRAKVLKSLSNLSAGGSTNGAAGIQRAYQIAMEQKIEGGVNRVILATDGDFNVGITGQDALVQLVKERAKNGVYLTVAGFGSGNLNDKMMDAITHDGNGNYFYIDSEREGEKVFLRNLSGTLVTIAKDVKIQVDFNPAKVGSYRLVGYSNRVLRNEDFNNDKVDAGDIGAGHTVTAFYELTPPGAGTDESKYQSALEKPGSVTNEWLTVKLRYKHPEGDESSKIEFPLTSNSVAIEKADSDFQFATAATLLGMKLRGMDEVSGVSWDQVIALARPGLANDVNEDRAEFVELVKKLAGNPRILPAPAEVVPGTSIRE